MPSRAIRWLGVTLLGALIACIVFAPEVAAWPHTPEGDGRFFFHQIAMGKAALRLYHELPLWNPFDCRGLPQWDHPEGITASPLLLLLTPFSVRVTYVLFEATHAVLGFVGMWALLRSHYRTSLVATFVGATMWSCSMGHIMQTVGAHHTFLGFFLAPWLLLLWRRAETSVGQAIALGALVSFMIYEGATYPVPFSGVMLALETLTRATPKRIPRIARAAAITLATLVLLSAPRVLPLASQMSGVARAIEPDTDALTPSMLWTMYTLKQPLWYTRFEGQQYSWHEYDAYVGKVLLALAAIGAALSLRRHWPALVLVALMLTFMVGNVHPNAPWMLLKRYVPPFSSMRVAMRFRLLIHLFLCGFVALAVDALPRWIRDRTAGAGAWAQTIVAGIALLAIGETMGLAADEISLRFQNPASPEQVIPAPRFHYGGPGLVEFIDQPRQNRAWTGCRNFGWRTAQGAPVWEGDVAQARVESGVASIASTARTMNTFRATVDVVEPAVVIFNGANWLGWTTNTGRLTTSNLLLAVELPRGHHEVVLRYQPPRLFLGVAMAALGALLIAAYAWRRRSRSALFALDARARPAHVPSGQG